MNCSRKLTFGHQELLKKKCSGDHFEKKQVVVATYTVFHLT